MEFRMKPAGLQPLCVSVGFEIAYKQESISSVMVCTFRDLSSHALLTKLTVCTTIAFATWPAGSFRIVFWSINRMNNLQMTFIDIYHLQNDLYLKTSA